MSPYWGVTCMNTSKVPNLVKQRWNAVVYNPGWRKQNMRMGLWNRKELPHTSDFVHLSERSSTTLYKVDVQKRRSSCWQHYLSHTGSIPISGGHILLVCDANVHRGPNQQLGHHLPLLVPLYILRTQKRPTAKTLTAITWGQQYLSWSTRDKLWHRQTWQ